jgi:tetratricopeptide (TPR) repeat protein
MDSPRENFLPLPGGELLVTLPDTKSRSAPQLAQTHTASKASPIGYLAALSILLFAATVSVYFPVRNHTFFDPDDAVYLTQNAHVQAGFSWSTIVWAFRTHEVNWHPLTWISHALDYQWFGLNPTGHHFMNVFFHAFNAFLLFWVLQRATKFTGRSFMVAALFALHPVNVEPVVWIAERKTLLSTTFFLLAFAAYRRYVESPRETRYWAVAGLFALALLAKPQVIAFPILLILWDYWPFQRLWPATSDAGSHSSVSLQIKSALPLINEKITLFAFAAADALMTLTAQGVTSNGYHTFPFHVRVENAIVCYVRYMGKAFWPANLSPYYPYPGNSLSVWQVGGSLALLTAISILVFLHRQRRYLVVGWLWYLISMVPMIGIVQVGRQAMADRYAYQPYIGLFIMVVWGTAGWAQEKKFSMRALQTAGVVVLIAAGLLCRRQVDYWKDDLTIWSHSLAVAPEDNEVVEYHFGMALAQNQDWKDGIEHIRRARTFAPTDPYINFEIGVYEQMTGNVAGSLPYYQAAINSPDKVPGVTKDSYLNMGTAYRQLGDLEHARQSREAADKINVIPPFSIN